MNHTAPSETQPRNEEIRARAYLLWEKANYPHGQDLDFWLQAEQQLAGKPPAQTNSAAASNGRKQRGAAPKVTAGARRASSPASNGSKKRQPTTTKKPIKARRNA